MLTRVAPARLLNCLITPAYLKKCFPKIDRMHEVKQPPEFHPEGDVWMHTLMVLEQLPGGVSVDPCMGRAAARRGQPPPSSLVPDASASTVTSKLASALPRTSAWRLRVFESGIGAGRRTGRKPHAIRGCGTDEGIDTQAILPTQRLSRASGTASMDCVASHGQPLISTILQRRSTRRFLEAQVAPRFCSRAGI